MTQAKNPHDHFFKRVFGDTENARDLLENYLPAEILEAVDLSTLRPSPGNYVDEGLEGVLTDVVFEAGLTGEESLYVYVLFEHKSYDERFVLLQVLKAMVMIWDASRKKKPAGKDSGGAGVNGDDDGDVGREDVGREDVGREDVGGEDVGREDVGGEDVGEEDVGGEDVGREKERKAGSLPVVIPFVVYHGERKATFPRRFRDLFGSRGNLLRYVPEFAYEFLNIRGLSDEAIRGKAETRAALLLMRHVFGRRLADRLSLILELAAGVGDPERRRSAVMELLWYTLKAARRVGEEEVARAVSAGLGRSGENIMPTIAEKWHNEGINEGMKRGMVQNAREFVLASLRARFGDTPGQIEAALEGIQSREVLKRLLECAVTARDLEAFGAVLREALETKSDPYP